MNLSKIISARVFALASVLSLCNTGFAQNGDCNTAISVCTNLFEEDNAPTGTGQVFEMAPGSCQTGGEFNSSWYVFTVQEDGALSFTLEPNDNWDDYDWSLFDITDNGCAGINSGQSPEVSCNSFGTLFGIPGPTGMSTAMGGSGTSNGPGDTFGPPFNADHPVTVGQTYALVVMNWTGSTNGYSLNFTAANTSIFDEVPPELISVESQWCNGEALLTFSEEVDLAGFDSNDFAFQEAGYTVTDITASSTTTSSNQITVTINGGAPIGNSVQLTLGMSNGQQLADVCGNAIEMPLLLDLGGEFNFSTTATSACNGTGGSLDVVITDGNVENGPFNITVNGGGVSSFPMQDLNEGITVVSITDAGGCNKTANVEIPNTVVSVSLPADLVLCSMNTTLEAQFQGDQIQWQAQSGIAYGNEQAASTLVTAAEPIQYNIQAIAQTGECTATDDVLVTFNIPPSVEIVTENISCFNACDGRILVNNASGNSITAFIDTNSSTGPNPVLENVCAGSYEMTIIHGPQCFSVYPITLSQPPEVVASFDASSTRVTVEEPVVLLTSTSANAVTHEWTLSNSNEVLSTETSWEIVMPQVPGTYELQLLVTDAHGCTDIFQGSILVESEFYFFVPNTFTPNNDGINDVFFVSFADEAALYEMQIFNRYGEMIFSTTDQAKAWTGNASENGQHFCPDGTYTWYIKAKGLHQIETNTYSGYVNIIR